MASTIPSVNHVFLTPEILEQILAYLTVDRLLIAQRVSPQWEAVIASSPKLQRLLFKRADHSLMARECNPLFESYFQDIASYPDTASSTTSPNSAPTLLSAAAFSSSPTISSISSSRPCPPAHLKIAPGKMRELLRKRDDPDLRRMLMFQPPCRYALTLSSASAFDVTVKFVNEADVPIMRAVEKAAHIVELEADKRRNLRRNLDRTLAVGVRGAGRMGRMVVGQPGAVNA